MQDTAVEIPGAKEAESRRMTTKHFTSDESQAEERNLWSSMMRGSRSRCPSCGQSKLFTGGLKVQDDCNECGEEFSHHRADDLPAYLNIFVVGHVVVAVMMIAFTWNLMGMWSLMAVTIAAAVLIAVLAMRPLKGMVVGAQWALRMHGFGGHDD